jgi:hypothetical protein
MVRPIPWCSTSRPRPRRRSPPPPGSWPATPAGPGRRTRSARVSSSAGATSTASGVRQDPHPHRALRPPARGRRQGARHDQPPVADPGRFYRYATEEGMIERSPAVHVRRPKLDYESHAVGLDRNGLGAFLVQARAVVTPGPRAVLVAGAQRSANLRGARRRHRTSSPSSAATPDVVVRRKGGKTVPIPTRPAHRTSVGSDHR